MLLMCLLLAPGADDTAELAKKMLPIYVKEAEAYSIAVESDPKRPLELKKEPIFEWANPDRSAQQGVVFVWLRDGRPAALASVFSHPHYKLPGRQIMHELHGLDPDKLVVKRDEFNQWKPEVGLKRNELGDAPVPAETAAARLLQMKKLAAEFSGHSVDRDMKKWELRLLPTPLYRYAPAKTGVVDGALFALVSPAGTDPEVLLLLEAREVDGKRKWEYAVGRFSDWELRVRRKDVEVFSSVPSETNVLYHDPRHLYRLYPEKVVTPDGKLLARIRLTAKNPDGELIPVQDK